MSNGINFRQAGKTNQNAKTGGRSLTSDNEKRQFAEKIWLHYFNQTLYDRGVINERERNKMSFKIENSKPFTEVKETAIEM